MDMRKYFDSISHSVLLRLLERKFKEEKLLRLFERIIESHRSAPDRGLPIGSLTSQHFANFYLGWLDHFIKRSLRVSGYVRYMDDCLAWGDSTAELQTWLERIRGFLSEELRLELKPEPYINRTGHGLDFLGCRVFPSHLVLNRKSKTRFARKLAALEREYEEGMISEDELQRRGTALTAFVMTEGVCSWRFRRSVINFDW